MPIEIKELHIRVAVSAGPPAPPKAAQGAAHAGGGGGGPQGGNKDEIVAECVEEVLRVLQARKER